MGKVSHISHRQKCPRKTGGKKEMTIAIITDITKRGTYDKIKNSLTKSTIPDKLVKDATKVFEQSFPRTNLLYIE